jgi:hypothetical protein
MEKVLYLTTDGSDYLQDQILIGMKNIPNVNCVDYPKKDIIYKNSTSHEENLHGGGFTIWNSIKEDNTFKRNNVIQRLYHDYFDLVVFGSIQRQKPIFEEIDFECVNCPVVFLDGEDERFEVTPAGLFNYTTELLDRRRHRGMPSTPVLGRQVFDPACEEGIYFKREKTPHLSDNYDIHPISFSIPKGKIRDNCPSKTRKFQTHVQCKIAYELEEVSENSTRKPIFDTEEKYYDDLAASKYGITMKKGGWECMRHYEIAANWAVPCFYNLGRKPQDCAPHGLYDMMNCISFSSAAELRRKIDYVERNNLYTILQENAFDWVKQNTCVEKSKYMLSAIETPRSFFCDADAL